MGLDLNEFEYSGLQADGINFYGKNQVVIAYTCALFFRRIDDVQIDLLLLPPNIEPNDVSPERVVLIEKSDMNYKMCSTWAKKNRKTLNSLYFILNEDLSALI